MTTLVYIGTAREQWALAAIDVALGRITAAELHELGRKLFRDNDWEDFAESDRLRHEINAVEADLRDSEDEVSKLEDEIEELERDNAALKKRIAELEGKPP